MLSVEGFQERSIWVVEITVADKFSGTVGSSISGSVTVTVMKSVEVKSPSLASIWTTKTPAELKSAVVSRALMSVNVTTPGPLNWLQDVSNVPPSGNPSSDTVAERFTVAILISIVILVPASTTGVLFGVAPNSYSTWRRGAEIILVSCETAVRTPVPVIIKAMALLKNQFSRLITSWTTDAILTVW